MNLPTAGRDLTSIAPQCGLTTECLCGRALIRLERNGESDQQSLTAAAFTAPVAAILMALREAPCETFVHHVPFER